MADDTGTPFNNGLGTGATSGSTVTQSNPTISNPTDNPVTGTFADTGGSTTTGTTTNYTSPGTTTTNYSSPSTTNNGTSSSGVSNTSAPEAPSTTSGFAGALGAGLNPQAAPPDNFSNSGSLDYTAPAAPPSPVSQAASPFSRNHRTMAGNPVTGATYTEGLSQPTYDPNDGIMSMAEAEARYNLNNPSTPDGKVDNELSGPQTVAGGTGDALSPAAPMGAFGPRTAPPGTDYLGSMAGIGMPPDITHPLTENFPARQMMTMAPRVTVPQFSLPTSDPQQAPPTQDPQVPNNQTTVAMSSPSMVGQMPRTLQEQLALAREDTPVPQKTDAIEVVGTPENVPPSVIARYNDLFNPANRPSYPHSSTQAGGIFDQNQAPATQVAGIYGPQMPDSVAPGQQMASPSQGSTPPVKDPGYTKADALKDGVNATVSVVPGVNVANIIAGIAGKSLGDLAKDDYERFNKLSPQDKIAFAQGIRDQVNSGGLTSNNNYTPYGGDSSASGSGSGTKDPLDTRHMSRGLAALWKSIKSKPYTPPKPHYYGGNSFA